MNLAEFAINKKVVTWALTSVLLVVGLMVYQQLPRLEEPTGEGIPSGGVSWRQRGGDGSNQGQREEACARAPTGRLHRQRAPDAASLPERARARQAPVKSSAPRSTDPWNGLGGSPALGTLGGKANKRPSTPRSSR